MYAATFNLLANKESKVVLSVCASVITEPKRLDYFFANLQSWHDQAGIDNKHRHYYVCQYVEPALVQEYERRLAAFRESHEHCAEYLHIVRRDVQETQFQNYRHLILEGHLPAVGPDVMRWILFSDDDDIWHKERVKAFVDEIERFFEPVPLFLPTPGLGAIMNVPSVRTPPSAFHCPSLVLGEFDADASPTADSITAGVAANTVHYRPYYHKDTEYVTYCAMEYVVRAFLEALTEEDLQSHFLDMVLARFLWKSSRTFVSEANWMYCYRRHASNISDREQETRLEELYTKIGEAMRDRIIDALADQFKAVMRHHIHF